jgi:hypothetical protein
MIPGTNCDGNYVRKFPDEPGNFTRLLRAGFGVVFSDLATEDNAAKTQERRLISQPDMESKHPIITAARLK